MDELSQLTKEELIQRLQSLQSRAEEAARLLDNFTAGLAHELRSPLNAILGWGNYALNHTSDPSKIEEASQAIMRNTHLAAGIIDYLLEATRLLRGKVTLNKQEISIIGFCATVLGDITYKATEKNIRVEASTVYQNYTVYVDPIKLQQVIINLMSNAIKFSPGQTEIIFRVTGNMSTNEAVIMVKDQGEGIDPQHLPYIFDKFYQGSHSQKQHGGLGLGLAIVKQLVELHGGRITAESLGKGKGSTFTVFLPLVSADHYPSPPEKSPTVIWADIRLSGLKVLIVEDNADSRKLLELLLKEVGAEIFSAATFRQAIEGFTALLPHVVISDIGLNDTEGDGYDAIQRIREIETFNQLPSSYAIALTGYNREGDIETAKITGFDTHLVKPLDIDVLLAQLQVLREKRV